MKIKLIIAALLILSATHCAQSYISDSGTSADSFRIGSDRYFTFKLDNDSNYVEMTINGVWKRIADWDWVNTNFPKLSANNSWTGTNTYTNNVYFNGSAKKTYFGSGHYLQLPGYTDDLTQGMIRYDAMGDYIAYIDATPTEQRVASQSWASSTFPLKNGTGATGTWGISISGNSATVTNGVYTVGDQTIAGDKIFTGYLISPNLFWARRIYGNESNLTSDLIFSNTILSTSTSGVNLTGHKVEITSSGSPTANVHYGVYSSVGGYPSGGSKSYGVYGYAYGAGVSYGIYGKGGTYAGYFEGNVIIDGSLGSTGIRVSKGWFTDLEVTNAITGSITGNAGTVTNGVYTSGSYSNPSWITSLAESKISFTDITTGNASASAHGFLPKLANTGTKYLRDDGTWQTVSGGGGGTVTSITTSSPITGGTITTTGTIGINDAIADGSTKGAASFTANDFNSNSGNISLDYTNMQKGAADGSTKGIVSFNANDFDASSGNISIDYINAQKASSSVPGFVSTDAQIFGGDKTFNNSVNFNVGFVMNGQVSYSVTGTGGKDVLDKNVVILTPTANGYTVTLNNLTPNRPIIVINGSSSYSFTLDAINSKTIAPTDAVWVMYNSTLTWTIIIR